MTDYKRFYQRINTTNALKSADTILMDTHFLDPQNFKINLRSNKADYKVESKTHPMEPAKILLDFQAMKAKNKTIFRLEEWTCKRMLGRNVNYIGTIADYQIPLKAPGSIENAGLGKVDLLSNNSALALSYLLELKSKNSTEHPLKAIMEIYTYWQMLGGDHATDFLTRSHANGKILEKAILIYQGSRLYNKLKDCEKTQAVMKKLGVKCFLLEDCTDELGFNVVSQWI